MSSSPKKKSNRKAGVYDINGFKFEIKWCDYETDGQNGRMDDSWGKGWHWAEVSDDPETSYEWTGPFDTSDAAYKEAIAVDEQYK